MSQRCLVLSALRGARPEAAVAATCPSADCLRLSRPSLLRSGRVRALRTPDRWQIPVTMSGAGRGPGCRRRCAGLGRTRRCARFPAAIPQLLGNRGRVHHVDRRIPGSVTGAREGIKIVRSACRPTSHKAVRRGIAGIPCHAADCQTAPAQLGFFVRGPLSAFSGRPLRAAVPAGLVGPGPVNTARLHSEEERAATRPFH